MEDGDSWTHLCGGASTQAEGDYFANTSWSYAGQEAIDIAGENVTAHRFEEETIFSGTSTGTAAATIWFAIDTGRPLAHERAVSVDSNTPYGVVTYSENSNYHANEP
jgi:hypothetical protein